MFGHNCLNAGRQHKRSQHTDHDAQNKGKDNLLHRAHAFVGKRELEHIDLTCIVVARAQPDSCQERTVPVLKFSLSPAERIEGFALQFDLDKRTSETGSDHGRHLRILTEPVTQAQQCFLQGQADTQTVQPLRLDLAQRLIDSLRKEIDLIGMQRKCFLPGSQFHKKTTF